MANTKLDFVTTGGNRQPSAADWASDIIAFGADNNVAIWRPGDNTRGGVDALLSGHTGVVTAVRILSSEQHRKTFIISGSADKTIRVWTNDNSATPDFRHVKILTDHEASINAIAVLPDSHLFVSGSADATLKVWKLSSSASGSQSKDDTIPSDVDLQSIDTELLQTITIKPRLLPLTLALVHFHDGSVVLAVGGTSSSIQLYVQEQRHFYLAASLTGHEGWIRSLDFVKESLTDDSDYLLASASQDRYIRLWRIHRGSELPAASSAASDPALGAFGRSLSNKAHYLKSKGQTYSVTFEALLIGHEDWIFTARWLHLSDHSSRPSLLSASADNSLAIWEADATSGFWMCTTRLGEISSQKGSTTATGSTGGFWIGLWSPTGNEVVSLGKTGAWRRWEYHAQDDRWLQTIGISGHTKDVKALAWARDGSYLLSTGADQTTRLFSEWKRDNIASWHEISRPQIHGYDLNCIDCITTNRFISGADEKLLRVFDKPRAVANLLERLCDVTDATHGTLPEAADIPVLGLSNKVVQNVADEELAGTAINGGANEPGAADPASAVQKSTLDLDHPPFEDHLARHTLWPEHEKLYGHGNEISAVAASHDGALVATACRASSIDYAVIRLYETKDWREIKPPLVAHSLTVTNLEFCPTDKQLLSVARDRQWFVFSRTEEHSQSYRVYASNPKAHSRMILDSSWAPAEVGSVFATASRDKSVNIWRLESGEAVCVNSIATSSAATAIAFLPQIRSGHVLLATGTETGELTICTLALETLKTMGTFLVETTIVPSKTINQLVWRPLRHSDGAPRGGNDVLGQQPGAYQLALASDDCSVRILSIGPAEVKVEEE
ncbi:Elongator subunit elp2 [Elasticomyces elasticus]|nr:Elongator subunit elp2 [Elasticomyces elasticus]